MIKQSTILPYVVADEPNSQMQQVQYVLEGPRWSVRPKQMAAPPPRLTISKQASFQKILRLQRW